MKTSSTDVTFTSCVAAFIASAPNWGSGVSLQLSLKAPDRRSFRADNPDVFFHDSHSLEVYVNTRLTDDAPA